MSTIYQALCPKAFAHTKAGARPPQWLVDTLAREHPKVALMWAEDAEVWCLMEWVGDRLEMILPIQTREGGYLEPDLENTVDYLNAHRLSFANDYDMEAWLNGIDQVGDRFGDEVEKQASEQRHDQSGYLYDKLRGRVIIPRN